MYILAKNLVKIYGNKENKVIAVDNVNLNIEEGKFLAIVGDSGSGKSTLLKLIGGLESLTSGELRFGETNLHNLKEDKLILYRRENIGFVFQDFNLIDFLTVKENIIFPVKFFKKNIDNELFNILVDRLKIRKILDYNSEVISGGEKQRVAIARALLMKPKLILADEPTGSLDSKNTEEVFVLFKELAKSFSQTVVMVTHNLELAKRCDEIIEMKDGKAYERHI